jgi:peroxiredoxin (alkyl hydroperoxide reductase subunit C)
MNTSKNIVLCSVIASICIFLCGAADVSSSDALKEGIYQVGKLKPVDSTLKVKLGDRAPDFTLMSLSGKPVSLRDYRGKKNVMLSFVPAAWTPVCSDQWPGYNIAQEEFDRFDTILLGITVDLSLIHISEPTRPY